MKNINLESIGLKPLCPTVIGSSPFPGWFSLFIEQNYLHPEKFGAADYEEALNDATRIAVYDQIQSGVELVSAGEMARIDFNLGFYDFIEGIRPLPIQRKLGVPAHDQRGKYVCVEKISAPNGLGIVDEYRKLTSITDMPKKVPVPGPFTLAGRLEGGRIYKNRTEITEALIPMINKEIKDLINEGCNFIQLDEPSFACHPDNPNDFIRIINDSLFGVKNAYISMHMCFGNYKARAVAERRYSPLFPNLLKANVQQFALEFASREMAEIEIIKTVTDVEKSVAVGLIDVKNLWVEPVEVIIRRIKKCLEYSPPELLHITADCGFSQTARYAAVEKMKNMALAVAKVRGK